MAQHDISVKITVDGGQAVAATNQVKGALNQVKNTKVPAPFDNVSSSAKTAKTNVDALDAAMKKIRNVVVGAFAVGSIYSFGKATLSAAAKTELLHKGLSFVLNSDSEADRLVKNMESIGEASAYDTTQLLPLSRAWVNIGDNVDTATSKMQKIVDLASAYGLAADQVGAVNLAMTQMQMAGKIGQQDMMQLINAGIPAWQLLSDKMGIPVEQLKDMSSKSELTQEALTTLWDAITEKTEGAASSMADTLSAKYSNAEEAIANSMSTMGDIISQGFDVPGILDAAGEMAEGFKAHINSIHDAAKDVGVHEAIVQELEGISPAAAAAADAVMTAFTSMKETITENQTAIVLVVEALGAMAATVAIIKGVQAALLAAKAAAIAFALACQANPIILAISAVVAALVLLYTHWDEVKAIAIAVKDTVVNAVSNMAESVKSKFDEAVNYAKSIWEGLKSFVSSPIETTVNVIRRTIDGGATASATGGVFGMAKGGLVGGLVPLANGGQLKHGTPAIVGEAGPEAVIPLKDSVLSTIGAAIMESYNKGKSGSKGSQAAEIVASIKSNINTAPVTAYAKIVAEAQKKASAIGEAVSKYTELQKEANAEMEAYTDGGEKAVQFQREMAALASQIEQAKASGDTDKAGALEQKQSGKISAYEEEKTAAIKAAQEIAAQREAIETESANALSSIRLNALEQVNARETALKEAQRQLESANNATSLSEFMSAMEAKDEMTGESYATTLANEQALAEMRQIWHEQLMTNAMEWSEYMNLTLTQMEQQITEGLAQGLSQCIVYGKNFREIMANLTNNVLATALQAVLQKAISSLMTMIGLGKQKTAQETASAAKEKAAEAAKSGTLAANATAALIAANPWQAYSAAGIVAAQMAAAAAAGAGAGVAMADGGLITGAGTGTSDSIPAMLSNGEYVINAAAVKRLGTPYLNMLNSPHYADGGQVGAGSPSAVSSGNVTLNVSAMDSSSFMDFLRNGGMDSIKQMLYDGNRDFTTAAGVW